MDKPVSSRFAHCGTQNSGLVAQELGLPFEQISSIYRKTSANAWNWYQRWLWRMVHEFAFQYSVRKNSTTFSGFPLLPDISLWNDPKSRGGSRIFFRRECTRLLLYFNTNKPHSSCRIPVALKTAGNLGGGGCAPPAPSPKIRPWKVLFHLLSNRIFGNFFKWYFPKLSVCCYCCT